MFGKEANSCNNGASEVGFGSLDGGEDAEHSGVGFVEKSKIFATQGAVPRGSESLDRVWQLAITICIIYIGWLDRNEPTFSAIALVVYRVVYLTRTLCGKSF